MILELNNLIEKTKHKEIFPKFTGVKNFVIKHYKIISIAFIIILPIAFYGYKKTDIYYNLDKSLPESLESVSANNELKDKFNMVSMELLLVDKDIPDYQVNNMLDEIENLEGIEWTLGYSKIADLGIPKEVLPEDLLEIFQNDEYQMIIINSKYEMATDELNEQVTKVNEIIKKYDENAILAGEGPLMKDLVEISNHDFNSVNTVSIGIIFVIMIIVLKSIFNEEGIDKICDYINGDLKDISARLEKLQELSEDYNNFTMLNDGNKGNVKFIMIMDSIKKEEDSKQDIILDDKHK